MGLCASHPRELSLDSFVLGKTLGRGGFGRVQAAMRIRDRSRPVDIADLVAIKRINKSRLLGLERLLTGTNALTELQIADRSICDADKTSALNNVSIPLFRTLCSICFVCNLFRARREV